MVESSRYEVHRFPFPIGKATSDLADSEWGQVTIGLDSDGVRNLLAWRWPIPTDPTLTLLREKLLTYRPVGIVTYDLQDYVQLDHPEVAEEPEGAGDSYYVAFPVPREEVEARMKALPVLGGEHGVLSLALLEFYSLFPGFREDFQTAGHFIPPGQWITLADDMRDSVDLSSLGSWQEALWIYHACNGDMIVLSRTGEVGWYCLSENEIHLIAEDFSGFLHYLIGYLDNRWPLDSFGPPEE
jgi:hypothetical protein